MIKKKSSVWYWRLCSSPESWWTRSLASPQMRSLPNHPMLLLKKLKENMTNIYMFQPSKVIYLHCRGSFKRCAYLAQWRRGAPRTRWLDCCFLAPALSPAGGKSVNSTEQWCVLRIFVKRNISHHFAPWSSPSRLTHLVGADSTKHLSVSLHLLQLVSGCRTEWSWFDLELI